MRSRTRHRSCGHTVSRDEVCIKSSESRGKILTKTFWIDGSCQNCQTKEADRLTRADQASEVSGQDAGVVHDSSA